MLDWILKVAVGMFLAIYALIVLVVSGQVIGSYTDEIGPFEVSIERDNDAEDDARLISLAEAVCPDVSAFERCDEPSTDSCAWSCGSIDGFLIPVAITSDLIDHYLQRVDELRAQQEALPIHQRGRVFLQYTAEVGHVGDEFEPIAGMVALVEMHFIFGYNCGNNCGFGFTLTRYVGFDINDEVEWLGGDGYPNSQVTSVSRNTSIRSIQW